MATKFIKLENHNTSPATFGGLVHFLDYGMSSNNKSTGSLIASKIESDRKFDEYCKNVIMQGKKYKNYTEGM